MAGCGEQVEYIWWVGGWMSVTVARFSKWQSV